MKFNASNVIAAAVVAAAAIGVWLQLAQTRAQVEAAKAQVEAAQAVSEWNASNAGVLGGDIHPQVGPAFIDSFKVTCATTATVIEPSGGFGSGSMISYSCQAPSTTKVAVGDSGIGDPTSSQNSPLYCTTNCPEAVVGANTRKEYCLADTGTVDLFCRALVAASSAP